MFSFEIIDDGLNGLGGLSITLTEIAGDGVGQTATASAQYTGGVLADNHVVFHNREANDIAYLDDVVIASNTMQIPVPEPSTFGVAALGLMGMGFLGRRRRKRS